MTDGLAPWLRDGIRDLAERGASERAIARALGIGERQVRAVLEGAGSAGGAEGAGKAAGAGPEAA